MDNSHDLEPIIVGVSVLLVFLTFLLHGITERINDLKDKPKSTARKTETDALNKKLYYLFTFQALPVTLIYLCVFWVIMPRTVEIMRTYEFNIWSFNELATIYVLIDFGLFGMFLFAAVKAIQTAAKWFEKRK